MESEKRCPSMTKMMTAMKTRSMKCGVGGVGMVGAAAPAGAVLEESDKAQEGSGTESEAPPETEVCLHAPSTTLFLPTWLPVQPRSHLSSLARMKVSFTKSDWPSAPLYLCLIPNLVVLASN